MTEAQAAPEDTSEKPQEMKAEETKDEVQGNDTKEADDSMDAESMHRDNNDEDDDDDSESGRKRRRTGADMQTEDGTEGGDAAATAAAAVRVKSGRIERRAVDREKTCPFLVRVYVKAAEHHSLADISAGKAKEDEHHLHLWKDSTLREISHLLSSKMPELNDPEIRLTFKILFHEFSPISSTASGGRRDSLKDGRQQRTHAPPPPLPPSRTTTQSAFKAKDIGQLSNMHKRTSDEFLTLEKVNFVAGDMIDVCIIKGVSIAGTAGAGVANAGINIAGKAAESHYGRNGNGRVSIESRLGSRRTDEPGAFGSESIRDRRGFVADEGRSYGGRSGGGGGGGRFHPYSAPSRGGRGGGSRAIVQDDRRSRSGW
ncbi:hypothetical protein HDU78_006131 [Chytriomyces hyalinus]|nr:hypothetical protein HDU78_006131 [Chytriomyces hyalinus]